ncbi:hypothetical protein [Bacillus sp. FJAT-29814]|uniref:hypothetical protein n=1 Tax=Bacillus sp. FJAT-29814 TaxID=1729688 RepID=UPI00083565CE|nr:hypothetical protein [Bacillus sp. FJAT-29814]
MYNYEVIEKAYQVYTQKLQKEPKLIELENKAVATMDSIKQKIAELPLEDENCNIGFVHDYLFGEGPDAFAAPMAIPLPGIENNLTRIVRTVGGQKRLRNLFSLVHKERTVELLKQIKRNSLQYYVHKTPDRFSPRPRLYSSRFELMLFNDMFTTIAYFPALIHKAQLVGIQTTSRRFEDIQYELRSCTDRYLEENHLSHTLTDFQKSALAWYIEEAS